MKLKMLKLTEQEYIDITDYQKVRSVIQVLSQITPASSVISEKDFAIVMRMLDKWYYELKEKFEIK